MNLIPESEEFSRPILPQRGEKREPHCHGKTRIYRKREVNRNAISVRIQVVQTQIINLCSAFSEL